ncbi:hypothetical protein A2767_04925 [Candidatus Roizmanbacteria bacterium RIFCSPHIGHO2_01_FULL_35_10]|nr:MAG: hypothetical protein A2767_04925 [Candidatus Roizmanbacteria bacterium RIFCSPHIGHO2_01_FULL_35_10]
MALKYQKIGMPSSHVVEILSVMDEVSKIIGVQVAFPSYIVRDGKGWQPNYEIYKEPIQRPFPKLCWKANLIFLEAQRMLKDEKVDALLIPKLETDRFRPCAGANGLIALIKNKLPNIPLLVPKFYDDDQPTLESISTLVKELGGTDEDARVVREGCSHVSAFEKSLERDAGKFSISADYPTIAVISHFREVSMLYRLSERYHVNFVPLREFADAREIPSDLVRPNPEFFQTEDVIARTNELYKRGDIKGLMMVMDTFCTPRKVLKRHLEEKVKAPVSVLELDEFDYLKILKEGRLRDENETEMTRFMHEAVVSKEIDRELQSVSHVEKC